MKKKIFNQYRLMKDRMLNCVLKPGARLNYHILAGAIYWTDEIPSGLEVFSENCLRLVLRNRTTLIIELPYEKWKPYWDAAKGEFQGWIGFKLERCSPSEELKQRFYELRSTAMKDFDKDLDDR